MSGRIDTPIAIPAPLAVRRPRPAPGGASTIWLTEPIDLRQAVERLDEEREAARTEGGGGAPEEIAQRLRGPRGSG